MHFEQVIILLFITHNTPPVTIRSGRVTHTTSHQHTTYHSVHVVPHTTTARACLFDLFAAARVIIRARGRGRGRGRGTSRRRRYGRACRRRARARRRGGWSTRQDLCWPQVYRQQAGLCACTQHKKERKKVRHHHSKHTSSLKPTDRPSTHTHTHTPTPASAFILTLRHFTIFGRG